MTSLSLLTRFTAQLWIPSCGVDIRSAQKAVGHHSLHAVIPLSGTFSQAGPVPRKTIDNLSPQQPHSPFQPHESTPSRGKLPDQFRSDFSVSCSDNVWCLQQQGLITVTANWELCNSLCYFGGLQRLPKESFFGDSMAGPEIFIL